MPRRNRLEAAGLQVDGNQIVKPRNLDREMRPDDLKITDRHYSMTLTLFRCASCGFTFADGKEVNDLVGLYERLADSE